MRKYMPTFLIKTYFSVYVSAAVIYYDDVVTTIPSIKNQFVLQKRRHEKYIEKKRNLFLMLNFCTDVLGTVNSTTSPILQNDI